MRAARSLHGGLAHLFAGLVVVQFFLAGLGAFTTIHNKKYSDANFGAHAALGTLMVVIALAILIVAAVGRWSPPAPPPTGPLFGLMVVQLALGVIGSGTAPWVGGLHAVNALLITGVAYLLVRGARRDPAPVATVQQPS
jgi:hypothetical protein